MTHPGAFPSFDLQRRAILERHARYVSLVVEELEAARRSDWRRVRELGAERARLTAWVSPDASSPLGRLKVRRGEVPDLLQYSLSPPSDESPGPPAGLARATQESTVTSRNLDSTGGRNQMRIRAAEPESTRDQVAREARSVGRRAEREGDAAAARDPGDQVRISAETSEMAANTKGELTAERIAEVREKILSGAYNSLDVVDEVARRFLVSGDL